MKKVRVISAVFWKVRWDDHWFCSVIQVKNWGPCEPLVCNTPQVYPALLIIQVLVFIKKANRRKENIILNSLYEFGLHSRRKSISLAQVLAFYSAEPPTWSVTAAVSTSSFVLTLRPLESFGTEFSERKHSCLSNHWRLKKLWACY